MLKSWKILLFIFILLRIPRSSASGLNKILFCFQSFALVLIQTGASVLWGVIFIFSFSAYADEQSIPVNIQVNILLKTLSYNKTLSAKTQKNINIGVLINSDNLQSINNKNAIIEKINESKVSISGFTINTVFVSSKSISDIKKNDFDIFYLTKDINNIDTISKVSRENNILTWSFDYSLVQKGNATLSVFIKNNKPKIIINLKNLKQESHDFSSNLLKLCEIIE